MNELYFIARIKDEEDRLERLDKWIKENIVTVSTSLKIIHKDKLTSEAHDTICNSLVEKLADELIYEKGAKISVTDRKYDISITAIKVKDESK